MAKKLIRKLNPKFDKDYFKTTTPQLNDYVADEANGVDLNATTLQETQDGLSVKINELIENSNESLTVDDIQSIDGDNTVKITKSADGKQILLGTNIFLDYVSNTGEKQAFDFKQIKIEGTEEEVLANKEVSIPTVERTKIIFNELTNINEDWNAKYSIIDENLDVLPTAELLNTLFNSIGIEVTTLYELNGNIPAKSVVYLVAQIPANNDPQIKYWTPKDGEAITIVTASVAEPAVLINGKWIISTIKDEVRNAIKDITSKMDKVNGNIVIRSDNSKLDLGNGFDGSVADKTIASQGYVDKEVAKKAPLDEFNNLSTTVATKASQSNLDNANSRISSLENNKLNKTEFQSSISGLETKIQTNKDLVNTNNLNINNDKDVAGLGEIKYDGTVDSNENRIATRKYVSSMGANLESEIKAVKLNADKVDGIVPQVNQALSTVSGLEQKITGIESNVNDALHKAESVVSDVSKNTKDLATETSSRTSADAALQSSINTLTATVAGKQNALTDAQKLVIDGEVFTTALKTTYDGYDARIDTNSTDIADNKAILDTTKAQSDLDHADVATLKTDLVATSNKAKQAYDLGQDWNTEKTHLVRRDELNTSATILGDNRGFVRVGTTGDVYECVLNTVFNGKPAMDFSTITGHPKAIAGIIRTLTVDGVSIVRTNSLSDPKWADDTAEGTDTIYLASDLTSSDKTANIATIKINATKITVDFTSGLTAGQRSVFAEYKLAGIEFIDTGASQVQAADTIARNAASAAQTTANTAVSGLNTKQDTLTSAQLAILAGVPFTSGMKTKYDGYMVAISGKQDRLSAAQQNVINGVPFTQDLKTELTDIGTVNVRDITGTTEGTFALKDFSGMVTSKAYVDAKIVAAGVPASVTTDLTQLKDVKVQKNGTDLSTAKTTLSALTSADLLVDKTYADAIVAGKQSTTLSSTIAGQSTVVGALTSINANVALANSDIATLKTSLNAKQDKTDNTFTTNAKTVSGAIIELHDGQVSLNSKISLNDTNLIALETKLGITHS